jgi:hypothetical protein
MVIPFRLFFSGAVTFPRLPELVLQEDAAVELDPSAAAVLADPSLVQAARVALAQSSERIRF